MQTSSLPCEKAGLRILLDEQFLQSGSLGSAVQMAFHGTKPLSYSVQRGQVRQRIDHHH